MRRFNGQVALVTGSGSGLGKAIAILFAREGARVALVDINEENLDRVRNRSELSDAEHLEILCDVSKSESVHKMVKEVVETFGCIDIVVNNAGINISHTLLEFPEEDWDRILEINLKSMFLVCKYAAPIMIGSNQGKIINMSSKSGGRDGSVNAVGYASSKAGVVGLTKSLALELAPHNINVNAVCPGFVYTPMWEKTAPEYAAKHRLSVEELKTYYISKIPLGRPQTEESIARVVAFLASEDAADITGEILFVTGGQ